MDKIVLFVYRNTKGVEDLVRQIREHGLEASVIVDPEEETVLPACREAIAIVTILTSFDRERIQRLDPSVRAIVTATMGYDHIDIQAARKRGITVVNVPDYAVQEVAVHQLSLILATIRRLKMFDRIVCAGAWNELSYESGIPMHRLSTMTYGTIGFGRIARLTADYARAFGMRVLAADPLVSKEEMAATGVEWMETPEELYRQADILSLNVPLTEQTRHLINDEAVSMMKDGMILVNTGRGAVIEEASLLKGLRDGKIGAAALDVFEQEPFSDTTHALMHMDNVILTPHIAYQTVESEEEVMRRAVSAAIEAAEGKVPENSIKIG